MKERDPLGGPQPSVSVAKRGWSGLTTGSRTPVTKRKRVCADKEADHPTPPVSVEVASGLVRGWQMGRPGQFGPCGRWVLFFFFSFLFLFPIFKFQLDLNSNKILICTKNFPTWMQGSCINFIHLFITLLIYLSNVFNMQHKIFILQRYFECVVH
jgi:hypothetical protein